MESNDSPSQVAQWRVKSDQIPFVGFSSSSKVKDTKRELGLLASLQ